MNKLLTSKKLIPRDQSFSSISHKFHKNDRVVSPAIGKRYKNDKSVKAKIRKTAKQSALSGQFSENRFDKKDLFENIIVKSNHLINPKKLESKESVIYISTTYKPDSVDHENIPTVDLTNSSEKLKFKEQHVNSKQLKTIFFPKRNFERDNSLKKTLATTSLINLPIIKKFVPKRLHSTTVIEKYYTKLSILDIPSQFLSWEDLNYHDTNILKKCELTDSDHEMIHWILERENENFELDFTLTSTSSSGYNSSLNTEMSLEQMLNVYDISSKDYI